MTLALAMFFGFSLAKAFLCGTNCAAYLLIIAVIAAAFLVQISTAQKSLKYAKTAFTFILFLAISAFYYCETCPVNPYPNWASREVDLTLEIQNATPSARGGSYGIATIKDAPAYFKQAKNGKIWFYLNDNPNAFRDKFAVGKFIVRPNANESDFEKYLSAQNIFFTASSLGNIDLQKAKFPYNFYESARDFIAQKLSILPDKGIADTPPARAYKAMILGDKSLLEKDAKDDFSKTGTMHIFAVSGLHVGMLAFVAFLFLNALGVAKNLQPFVCLPILFLYVNICQARPSAMRAFLMIAFVWLSVALCRKPKTFAALCAAFVVSLLINPNDLFDAGFELSYAIVCAIVLYATGLIEFIEKWRGFRPRKLPILKKMQFNAERWFIAAACISFAAFIASAPLTALYFGYIAPLGILFSIVYVLAATFVVAGASIAIILPQALCQYVNFAAAKLMQYMLSGAQTGADLNLNIDLSLTKSAAFAIVCLNIFALLYFFKIDGAKKWLAYPATGMVAILAAYIF